MRNRRYLTLAILPLAAVWLFVVGQSMRSLVTTIAAAPVQPAAQSATGRSSLPIEEANLPLGVDADGSPGTAEAATELQPHPEITDPHIRKLLQAAWDD
jgi:hypothetical protein